MATRCMKVVRGTRLRVTLLDGCARVVEGECSQVVTSGFVTATLTMETEDGSEISVTNAAGDVCIQDRKPDYLNFITAEIEFCEVDPDLFALINSNYKPIVDADGNTVGFQLSTSVPDRTGFALEIWSDLIGSDVCDDPDAQGAWGYMLLPYLTGGLLGDIEFTNDAVTFTISANTRTGNRWGQGPYGVVDQGGGIPGPLWEPIDSDAPALFLATTIAPPEAQCGCQPVTAFPTEPLAVTAEIQSTNPYAVTATATNAKGSTATFDWGDGSADSTVAVSGDHTATADHTYPTTT